MGRATAALLILVVATWSLAACEESLDLHEDGLAWACEEDEDCGSGWRCGEAGVCVASGSELDATPEPETTSERDACTPDCSGKACGPDGCEGTCGSCGSGESCSGSGQCVCEPDCAGRQCGDNGCGTGLCGTCSGGLACSDSGGCVEPPCGELGAPCPSGFSCEGGHCVSGDGAVVWVPGGPFMMGCDESVDEDCDDDEYPRHEVEVPGFIIDRTEGTVEHWQGCIDGGACQAVTDDDCDLGSTNYGEADRAQHPMNCVDWNQAEAYCAWADKRLCTESEWEKAARGTDRRRYPWGNEEPTCENDLANFDSCVAETTPVGSYSAGASPYGAEDMAGNVREWVADHWHTDYEGAPIDGSAWEGTSSTRVLRGGRFDAPAANVRSGARVYVSPAYSTGNIGLRCCRSTE